MSLFTSLFSGSLLGIFGAIGTNVLDFFKQKQKNKHELDVLEKQKEIASIAATSQTILETLKTLSTSYEADKSHYSGEKLSYVDQIRGLTRPVLTAYITIECSYLVIYSLNKVGLSTALMEKISEYSVYASFELAGICIGWWFGSRGLSKFNGK